tara:strand:+ start:585 stop:743 length:159 start_codon:yes stop_codon:yes gene_type:complete
MIVFTALSCVVIIMGSAGTSVKSQPSEKKRKRTIICPPMDESLGFPQVPILE